MNDFEDAELIIGSMWGDEKLDLTVIPELLRALIVSLDHMVDFLYHEIGSKNSVVINVKVKPLKGIRLCQNAEDLCENLPVVLRIFGVHLGLDAHVFYRVLRVVNYWMVQTCSTDSVKLLAYRMTGEYFLPALTIITSENLKLDRELWEIMKHIEFKNRYFYYQELLSRGYLSNFCMLEKFIELHPKVVKWSKSLSDEAEQIELMRKSATQLANNGNCLIITNQILRMITNYENLIGPLLQTMNRNALQDLALDMVAFSILRNLTEKHKVY